MSFPPGTEMFQFPGFASAHYGFMCRYPCGWVAPFGYPRINACSRLPMAFRSVPRPSSPPGAKASTECPSHARELHHAQKPSSAAGLGTQCSGFRTCHQYRAAVLKMTSARRKFICSAHNRSIIPAEADTMDYTPLNVRAIAWTPEDVRSDFATATPRDAPEPDLP